MIFIFVLIEGRGSSRLGSKSNKKLGILFALFLEDQDKVHQNLMIVWSEVMRKYLNFL